MTTPRSLSRWAATLVAALSTFIAAAGCASAATTPEGELDAGACTFPLVTLRTGSDTACSGGNTHAWPIGMAATACHGWRAVDTTGREHDNSANDIKCNPDGSFSFVQFAGNLECTGTGVLKTYMVNACQRDVPPTLYTVAIDLTCCSDPAAAGCRSGVPSVSVAGGSIFLNSLRCVP